MVVSLSCFGGISPRPLKRETSILARPVISVRINQRSELGKVVLGNSVTLTPGTVTLQVEGDMIEVHALNEGSAEDVEQGTFDERVPASIEEKS